MLYILIDPVLGPSSNQLHEHVTILFTIYLLMDIGVVSRFGLLQTRLLRTFMSKSLYRQMLLFLLDK